MSCVLLFVHSPLVGPSTWAPVAEAARSQDWLVRVPDLTHVAGTSPPFWEAMVESAVAGAVDTEAQVVVVGHSGAGVFLPAIGGRLGGRLRALVFVDAQVPPMSGAYRTPLELEQLLDEWTVEGVLRRWWDWWPADTLEDAIPDAATRTAIQADMPQLPRAFYDESVPVPDGWAKWPCGFVKLSDAYQSAFEEAGQRGWPREAVDGHHLSLVTHPELVLGAVETIVAKVGRAR